MLYLMDVILLLDTSGNEKGLGKWQVIWTMQ